MIRRHTPVRLVALTALMAVVGLVLTIGAWPTVEVAAVPRQRVLRGKDARDYEARLRASNAAYRQSIDRAEEALRSRGWLPEPDGVIVVELFTETVKERPGVLGWLLDELVARVSAQSVYKSDGRGIWSSWNDGNPGTWEGTFYGENYTWSAYSSASLQFDITGSGQPPVIYSSQISRSAQEGNLPCSWHGGACVGFVTKHAMQHAISQAWPTCGTAAVGCIASGPAYWECLGLTCIGAITAYFINEMRAWTAECNNSCGGCQWRQISPGIWECN
jgi:hypothetical protein